MITRCITRSRRTRFDCGAVTASAHGLDRPDELGHLVDGSLSLFQKPPVGVGSPPAGDVTQPAPGSSGGNAPRGRACGFVREFRPELLVTIGRGLASTKLLFVSSDRAWPPRGPESLASAFDLPLVTADGLEPATAVTSREHRTQFRPLENGPK